MDINTIIWPILVFICQAVIFAMTRKNSKYVIQKYLSLFGMIVVVEWFVRIYIIEPLILC